MLTARRAREVFAYDPRSGFLVWKKKVSRKVVIGRRAGSIDRYGKGRRTVRIDGRLYYEHRVIWLILYGRWPREQIDHVNVAAGDNRENNLREASNGQNVMNREARSDNALGLRGVYRLPSGRFRARFAGHHLGCFQTAEEAHAVWRKAARRLYGRFVK